MNALNKSTVKPRNPTPPVALPETYMYQGIGAFVFGGKDSRLVDYGAYLAIPALVREAAKRGVEAATEGREDPDRRR